MSRPRVVVPKFFLPKRLGEVLCQSGLITVAQLEVALYDQREYSHIRLGEILALRGWLKQETADFFAEQWPQLYTNGHQHPLGHYLQQAALLDGQQVAEILNEQQQTALKFGALAVLHGWIHQQTLDFFLDTLFPAQATTSAYMERNVQAMAEQEVDPDKTIVRDTLPSVQDTLPNEDIPWLN